MRSFLLERHLAPSVTILVWTVNVCRKCPGGPISVAIDHSFRKCLRVKLRRGGSAKIRHILSIRGAPKKIMFRSYGLRFFELYLDEPMHYF